MCLSHVDFGPSLININRSRKKSSSYNWRIVKGELRKKKLESRILLRIKKKKKRILFVIFGGYILSLQYWVANTCLVFSLFTNKDVRSLDLTCLVVLCSHTFFYVWYFLMYGWLLKRLRKKQFWSNYSLFRVESYLTITSAAICKCRLDESFRKTEKWFCLLMVFFLW